MAKRGFNIGTRAAQVPTPSSAPSFSLARLLGHESYDTDPLSKTSDTLKTYSGWVFAAVSTISNDVRSAEWGIWEKSGTLREDWKRLDEARIPTVITRPNATQTWGDLIELTQVHMDLAGKAFWHLITAPGSQQVAGIQILNPDWVTGYELDDTKTRHIAWKLQVPGSQARLIAADDVLFFRYPDPVDPFAGMSPVRAVAMSYDMDTYARAYGAQHLRNHAQPTGILTTESDLTREQATALAESWKDTHLGADSIQVLGKGAQYQPLGAMLRDLEFLNLARVSRDQILAAYHVPASRLGLIEDSSRANGEESDRVYSSLCLGPRLRRYEEPITLRLLPRLGLDPSRFVFEFDSVDVADKEFDRIANAEAFAKGAITLNEYRSSIGLGPEKNGKGDVYYMPLGAVVSDQPETGAFSIAPPVTSTPNNNDDDDAEPSDEVASGASVGEAAVGESVAPDLVLNGAQVTSLIQIVAAVLDGSLPYASALEIIQSAFGMSLEKAQRILGPPSNAGSNRPPEEPAPDPTEAASRAVLAVSKEVEVTATPDEHPHVEDRNEVAILRFLRGHDKNERRMKSEVRVMFEREAKMMVAAARDGTLSVEMDGVEVRAAGSKIIKETKGAWTELFTDEINKSLKTGFDLLGNEVGITVKFDLVDKRAVKYAASKAKASVKEIGSHTSKTVARVVKQSVNEGWSTQKTAKAIREKYNEFKGARTQTIARTEVGDALNAGKHLHAQEIQEQHDIPVKKQWLPTQGDDRVREHHRMRSIESENNGTRTLPLDDAFIIKGMAMQRPGDPAGGPDNVINCRCVLIYGEDD